MTHYTKVRNHPHPKALFLTLYVERRLRSVGNHVQCCRYLLCAPQSEQLYWWGSTTCAYTVFRFFSLPSPGFFSPFPPRYWFTIGQSGYLAEVGSPYSDRIPRVPPYSSSSQHMRFFVYGAVVTCIARLQTLPLTHMLIQALGSSPRSLAALLESPVISFLGVLRCFSSPVRLINLWIQLMMV